LDISLAEADYKKLNPYGELPENAKIDETDAFGEEEGECTFEFGEDGEVDIDDIQLCILVGCARCRAKKGNSSSKSVG
jgi:hypothetical protein